MDSPQFNALCQILRFSADLSRSQHCGSLFERQSLGFKVKKKRIYGIITDLDLFWV
jgi:hypothetical protein